MKKAKMGRPRTRVRRQQEKITPIYCWLLPAEHSLIKSLTEQEKRQALIAAAMLKKGKE